MDEDLRIAVLGAGANGASIGADLTRAGYDVTFIEQWPDHVEAMRRDGVRIEMPTETLQVPVQVHHLCDVATFRRAFDVVLVLMKAYDTRWSCQLIEPYVAADGVVVGVQNGMTADVVADVVGVDRSVGCVIEISSMMFDPGIVQRHSPPDRSWFAIGPLDDAGNGWEEPVAELLRSTGTVELVDDIRATKWMKLVSNATTLVTTALLGLPMLEAAQRPEVRELMVASGQEALQAGAALGYPPMPIFGLAEQDLGDHDRVVEVLLDTLLAGFVLPTTETTILQDWKKGRRSEAGDINGRVVAELERDGASAPVNRAVVEVARRIEQGELDPSPANLDILRDLVEG